MSQRKDKQTNHILMKWLLIIVTTSLLVGSIILLSGFGLHKYYEDKFVHGIYLAETDIGGLNVQQAKELIQPKIDTYKQVGLKYNYKQQEFNVPGTITTAEAGGSYDIISYYTDETLNQLWKIGHQQGYTRNFWQQLSHIVVPRQYALQTRLNQQELEQTLKNEFDEYTTPARSAQPQINSQQDIAVQPHSLGMTFDYQQILKQSLYRAAHLKDQPIVMNLEITFPSVMFDDVESQTVDKLQEFLQQEKTLSLNYENQNWNIPPTEYTPWIVFGRYDDQISPAFDEDDFNSYLKDNIIETINLPTQDAKFTIQDGRVVEFQASRDGQKLNPEETIKNINLDFFDSQENEYELVINQLTAKVVVGDTNDVGITELIGVGRSNFRGSPPNRVHNIKTGAAAINGLIVKPGETFSLITALGDIDAANGYLPELVIKGNQTIPEYGGGLCQLGTTVFRSAIDTGLPIVERRNHSYRVSYYEPAGFDATIYSPKPDMRFSNDTSENALIQARVEGTELIVEMWGTSDGREVNYSEPRIYNITPPPPTKIIKTTDLQPGQRRCTESAHAGADAEFDYRVEYSDGNVMEETFTSHYVPWQEVCLVGVAPEELAAENEDTSQAEQTDSSQENTVE